jgi:transposase
MQPLNVPASKQPLPMALGAWSLPELLGAIATRDATIEQQQREIERLRERVEGQSELLAKTQQALLEMRAKLANARQEMFGASRERMSAWQLDIFDQAHEAPLPPQQPDLSIPVRGTGASVAAQAVRRCPTICRSERVVHAIPEQELSHTIA